MSNLALLGVIILHLETFTVGRVVRVMRPGEHHGPDGESVDEAVVELDTGDRFLLRDGAFLEIAPAELAFVEQFEDELRVLLVGAAVRLQEEQKPPGRAVLLCRAALSRQLRALAPRGDDVAAYVSP